MALTSTTDPAALDRFASGVDREQDMTVLHDLMTPEKNVQRIMWTGTAWFIGAAGTTAVFMAILLASGWRPAILPPFLGFVWWFGSVVTGLSIGLIGWSGCPILEVNVPIADRNKTRTMQVGTLFYIVGGVLCLFAVMQGPVGH